MGDKIWKVNLERQNLGDKFANLRDKLGRQVCELERQAWETSLSIERDETHGPKPSQLDLI